MTTANFSRVFAAAHRVWNDTSKCSNVHGHNYRVDITIAVDALNEQNFVIPFDEIKQVVDQYDHTLILDEADPLIEVFASTGLALSRVPGVPSTEFMADLIAQQLLDRLVGVALARRFASVSVAVRETDGIQAFAIKTIDRSRDDGIIPVHEAREHLWP